MTGSIFDATFGEHFALYHADSVLALPGIPDNAIDLSISSWPFSDQYMYSPSVHDFGNVDNDAEFFAQMDYLLPQLLRVTVPGRMAIVHAKDRIVYGTQNDGYTYIQPFSDACIRAMVKHGWLFYGRITVATDPVRENAQTHRLTHGELQKDATRLGVGMPEYVLLFRKPHTRTAQGGTWSDKPVTSLTPDVYSLPRWQLDANSLWRSDGKRLLLPYEADGYNYHGHVAHLEAMDERRELGRANGEKVPCDSPWVWWDIDRTDVLNVALARDNADERHICPLQLDLIERCITRWSNPGDVVLDYFSGVGSVPYMAVRLGRRGVGVELKDSYHQQAVRYLTTMELSQTQSTIFDTVAVPV